MFSAPHPSYGHGYPAFAQVLSDPDQLSASPSSSSASSASSADSASPLPRLESDDHDRSSVCSLGGEGGEGGDDAGSLASSLPTSPKQLLDPFLLQPALPFSVDSDGDALMLAAASAAQLPLDPKPLVEVGPRHGLLALHSSALTICGSSVPADLL